MQLPNVTDLGLGQYPTLLVIAKVLSLVILFNQDSPFLANLAPVKSELRIEKYLCSICKVYVFLYFRGIDHKLLILYESILPPSFIEDHVLILKIWVPKDNLADIQMN